MDAVQVDADGVSINVEVIGAGRPFVFLHGSMGTGAASTKLLTPLAEDHMVVAPDLRGRGRSRCPDPNAYSWTAYTRDLLCVLRPFRPGQRCGRRHVPRGGRGLGRGPGRTRPDRPSRADVQPLCRRPGGTDRISARHGRGGRPPSRPNRHARPGRCHPAARSRHPDQIALYRRWQWQQHHLPSICAATIADARMGQPFSRIEGLSCLTMPVLLIAGNDLMHPGDVSRQYLNVLPDATLTEVVPQPEPVSDAIRNWLAQTETTAS